jgi:hypothetical protein
VARRVITQGTNTQPEEWIMKRKQASVLWAGLLAFTVGCSSTGMYDSNATASSTDAAQGGGLGAVNSTSDSGTAASADTANNYGRNSAATTGSGTEQTSAPAATGQTGTQQAVTTGTASMPTNSTVTSIEVVQRHPGTATTDSTTIGSSGTGATGSSTMGDRMYRITVRMDDGTSQVVTQESAPSFVTGERVRTVSGAIQRQ